MDKRTKKIILLHLVILLLGTVLVFQFCEEIVEIKQKIYSAVSGSSEESEPEQPDLLENCREYLKTAQCPPVEPEGWYQDAPLIYHAAGAIGEDRYTNSREALENTLRFGHVLEIDFLFTGDGRLVCAHDWSRSFSDREDLKDYDPAKPDPKVQLPTLAEFLDRKVYGKYTPMTAEDLIGYMREYPQLYVVIDTKEPRVQTVVAALKDIAQGDPDIMHRFIIQLYGPGEKEQLLEIFPFERSQFLFTLYKFGKHRVDEILKICCEEEIPVITMSYNAWDDETVRLFRSQGITLYEHTLNRPEMCRESVQRGISSFYTDLLTEKSWEK